MNPKRRFHYKAHQSNQYHKDAENNSGELKVLLIANYQRGQSHSKEVIIWLFTIEVHFDS